MTLEFILAALDPCNACPEPRGDCPPECTQRRAFEELQKNIEEYKRLREKATPKKPIRDIFRNSTCPECNRVVRRPYYKYCPYCRQKIDWKDREQ